MKLSKRIYNHWIKQVYMEAVKNIKRENNSDEKYKQYLQTSRRMNRLLSRMEREDKLELRRCVFYNALNNDLYDLAEAGN